MYTVKFDSKEVNRILGNAVSYSYGFLEGIDMDQILFNKTLAEYTTEALELYIDSQARVDPESLHHVYEWDQVGSPGGRLFEFQSTASKRIIKITGGFLQSSSVSDTSDEPFYDKANIMENAIAITIEPKNSDFLVFEDDNQTIFTTKAIYIANPGGDAVAGSFGRVVDDFFNNYFTNALLRPLILQLSNPTEYARSFRSGTKSGRGPGINAGKAYLRSAGASVQ